MTYDELNDIRKHLALTTKQMACMVGVSHSTYRNWSSADTIPLPVQYIAEVLRELPQEALRALKSRRGVTP